VSCHAQDLKANIIIVQDEIARRIQAFFARHIADLIPLDNYVIDFGIASADDKEAVTALVADGGGDHHDLGLLVIELNPFGAGADPGLFGWRQDRAVLEGDAPFEFRVREAPFDVKPFVICQWRELIAVPAPQE
jgi:hypothetical protein